MGKASAAVAKSELLDVEQAVDLLKTSRATFYRWLHAGHIKGLRTGRKWRFEKSEIERFMKGESPQMDVPAATSELIQTLAARLRSTGQPEMQEPSLAALTAAPIARLILLLVRLGPALRATDLHIEPIVEGDGPRLRIRYRIDGVLHTIACSDVRVLAPLLESLKRMGQCDPAVRDVPQDCRIMLSSKDSGKGKVDIDLRVCFLPTHLGEAITIRFLVRKEQTFDLDVFGFGPPDLSRIRSALALPWGLLIVSGPTGSGKTTLLYSCLMDQVSPELKVMSIEDPVEYALPGVLQAQINPKSGMTFARAMRAALRSDPDVMMLGEIRDLEVLNLCCQAALTGHLVMTTLHADTAVGAILRVLNIGLEPFLASDCLKMIAAQRLIRRLCPHCSRPSKPAANLLHEAQIRGQAGGLGWDQLAKSWREPIGCAKCGSTGFHGRVPINEMLQITPELAAAIRRKANEKELLAIAVGQDMTTMAADGIRRAAAGEVSLEETLNTAPRMPA